MDDLFNAGHLMLQDTLDLGKFGYSIYQDQRDNSFKNKVFDYQKSIQQKIFDREDTALQRRMADAEKAGLNPFSVANGSGAGAGAVVGTSSASYSRNIESPNVLGNYGRYLDSLNAIEQNKQMKEHTRILTEEWRQAHIKAEQDAIDRGIQRASAFLDSGVNADNILISTEGSFNVYHVFNPDEKEMLTKDGLYVKLSDSPMYKRYLWALENDKNVRDSIEYNSFSDFYNMKQNEYSFDWMNFDRNYQRILKGVEGITDLFHGGSHAVEAINSVRDVSGRNKLRESQIQSNDYKNRPTHTTKERTYNKRGYTERSYSSK